MGVEANFVPLPGIFRGVEANLVPLPGIFRGVEAKKGDVDVVHSSSKVTQFGLFMEHMAGSVVDVILRLHHRGLPC